MFKKVAIVLVVAIVGFLAFVATRPDSYRVERSIEIQAPPEAIYAVVSDFNRFNEYSPWAALDTSMKTTITGEPGKGQIYEWKGNDEVGEGKMTNTEAAPPTKLVQSLVFITPMESKATTGYDLIATGETTKVTWWMAAENDFPAKLFGVFVDFESMIGADYDKGLKSLKQVAEKDAKMAAEKAAAEEAAEEAAEDEADDADGDDADGAEDESDDAAE